MIHEDMGLLNTANRIAWHDDAPRHATPRHTRQCNSRSDRRGRLVFDRSVGRSVGRWVCRWRGSKEDREEEMEVEVKKKWAAVRRWFSGRMLACHAGGPGSIPGRRMRNSPSPFSALLLSVSLPISLSSFTYLPTYLFFSSTRLIHRLCCIDYGLGIHSPLLDA